MGQIGHLWAGKVFGTNTGNLFVELTGEDDALKGTLRFRDDQTGPIVFGIAGTFEGGTLKIAGAPAQVREGVTAAPIEAECTLTPEGNLRGIWSSPELGTGGTLILFPHDTAQREDTAGDLLPERLHTATRNLGAIRLYGDDLQELIGFVRRDYSPGSRVVVTYYDRGNEISVYATDFLNDESKPKELRFLKLVIQEPEAHGINRLTVVELGPISNEVRSQGVQESWVQGKAESVTSFLKRHQKALATTVHRFGLNLNTVLLLIVLVLLPELSLWRRAAFLLAAVGISWAFNKLHASFIPNALIYLTPRTPTALQRAGPAILSWLITASAGLAAAAVYGLLKGEITLPQWIVTLLQQ